MTKQSIRVKAWRARTKQRLIDAFGGKCAICGYNKCPAAFEFHHLDPTAKEMHWGQINGSIISWKRLIKEMSKCVMLCSNCHKEHHYCGVPIPSNAQTISEDYTHPGYYDLVQQPSRQDNFIPLNARSVQPVC